MYQEEQLKLLRPTLYFLGALIAGLIALFVFKKKEKEEYGHVKWIIKEGGNQKREESGSSLKLLLEKDIMKMEWLLMAENKSPLLMHQIIDLPLCKLTRLQLTGNYIPTIQNLTRVYLPNLQYLQLSNNNIREVKSLRKILSSNVTYLQLFNNPVIQFDPLTQLNSEHLIFFWIQFFGNDLPCNDDVRWLVKAQSNLIQRFHCNGDQRILQKKVYECLKRKNKEIQIRHKGLRT